MIMDNKIINNSSIIYAHDRIDYKIINLLSLNVHFISTKKCEHHVELTIVHNNLNTKY